MSRGSTPHDGRPPPHIDSEEDGSPMVPSRREPYQETPTSGVSVSPPPPVKRRTAPPVKPVPRGQGIDISEPIGPAPATLAQHVDEAARRPFDAQSVVSIDNNSFGSMDDIGASETPVPPVSVDPVTGQPSMGMYDAGQMSVHQLLAARRQRQLEPINTTFSNEPFNGTFNGTMHSAGTPGSFTGFGGSFEQNPHESGTPTSGLVRNASFMSMGSFGNSSFMPPGSATLPPEIVRIARQMRGLDEKQFLMLTDLTQKRAWRNVYSMLEYRGTSWYLPALRPLEDDEPGCGVGFERTAGLWIAMCGWRLEINVIGYLIRISMLVALWLALWANFPDHYFELRGAVFDPAVAVLFSAIVGGIISRVFRIPSLVCVLWAAILWHNVPSVGYFTSGISKPIRSAGTTFGLTVILIRAGLYIKPEEIKPILGSFAAFALLPGIAELVTHSMVAKSIFEYPDYTWAFSHGAIAAVVSPAVVVPAMLNLKMEGFCLTRGPGMLMMPASPAEMVAGIWNVNFMAQLTIDTGDKPLWLNILLGPLQIIGGLVLGVILGCVHFLILKALLAEAKKLPHRAYTAEHMNNVALLSSISMVVFGAACLAYTKELSLSGGGAVAVTVMAMVSGALHRRRYDTPYFAEQFKYLSTNTAELWDTITMPVLFTMVGTGINLGDVFTAEFFPKILACLVCGLVARMALTIAVTAPQDYDVGERVVMAIGWCGKASVQAALGRVVLDRAVKNFDTFVAKDGLAIAQRNVDLAKQITNSAIVMILVCAPIAALTLVRIGPYVFRNEKKAASPAK